MLPLWGDRYGVAILVVPGTSKFFVSISFLCYYNLRYETSYLGVVISNAGLSAVGVRSLYVMVSCIGSSLVELSPSGLFRPGLFSNVCITAVLYL